MDVQGIATGMGPIIGVNKEPLVSLDRALKPLERIFGQSALATAIWFGKDHAQELLSTVRVWLFMTQRVRG